MINTCFIVDRKTSTDWDAGMTDEVRL